MDNHNHNHDHDHDLHTETLSETDNFIIYRAVELDGEVSYHLELGMATLHFFQEEWEEFLALVRGAIPA